MNSVVLDIFIGLTLIFCLYSLLSTVIKEFIAQIFKLRANQLEKAISRMLTDESIASPLGQKLLEEFHGHALYKYMSSSKKPSAKPSYISPANFSKIMIDVLKKFGENSVQPEVLKAQNDKPEQKLILEKMNLGLNELLKTGSKENATTNEVSQTKTLKQDNNENLSDTVDLLKTYIADANTDLEKFKSGMEQWFNDTMDRTSGWYKRQSQWIVLAIGFVLALIFNVNTFEIVRSLSVDKTAREQLVSIGISVVKDSAKIKPFINANGDTINNKALLDSTLNYVNADLSKTSAIMGLGWNYESLAKEDSMALHVSGFVRNEVLGKILQLNKTVDTLEQKVISLNKDSLKALLAVNRKVLDNYIGIFNDSTQADFVTINSVKDLSAGKDSCVVFGKVGAGFFPKVGYIISQSLPWESGFWGLLITALMISLGAPFWFDLLSKFVQLRSTGPRIDTKPAAKKPV